MMKFKAWTKLSAFMLLSLSSLNVLAGEQKVMSLEQCLAYAKENNISLKQAKLDVEDYTINESTAKGAFYPKVSGSIGQGFSNSPFSEGTKNAYSGSYGIDLSMTIYAGGANSLNLSQSKLDTKQASLGLQELENNLDVSITQCYIEILYATEQIKVVENSLALSQKNIERGKKQLDLGSINEADYAQLVSAEATEKYNLVVAQNSLRNKYLTLKQLLEIEDNVDLQAKDEDYTQKSIISSIPSIDEVYTTALGIRPEIASSKLSVEIAELDEKIARSDYFPTISLSAGAGLSHSSSSEYTFTTQLKSNYNHSLGVNVSIPIFNRLSTKNSVRKSQNAIKYANLALKETSKTLYQTIETLYTSATNAKAMYEVSELKLSALEKSLNLVTKQFELGTKDIIELLTEQNDYRQANQEYLESKYTFILNKAILEYYKTGIIKL